MPVISMDALPRMTTVDLAQSDTISRTAGATTAFDDYLEQAQSQDATIGQDQNTASFDQSGDVRAAAPSPGVNSWTDSDAPSESTDLQTSDRNAVPDQGNSTLQAPDQSKAPASATEQGAKDGDPSSTTSNGQDRESSSSDNRTSSTDAPQSTKNEKSDADKAKQDDSAAVVLDIGANSPDAAAKAAQAAAAAGNASSINVVTAAAQQPAVAAAAVPVNVSPVAANSGNTRAAHSPPGRAGQTSGTKSALAEKHNSTTTGANSGQAPASTGEAANGGASGQAAAAGAASAATAAATTAGSASVTTASSTATASATSGANSAATAPTATTAAAPGAIDASLVQAPVSAPAPAAEQASAAATTTSTEATTDGVQAARGQRAKAAVDALTSTGSGDNGTAGPAPSGNAGSTVPVAASSSANNTTATSGTTAANSAETTLSQADRVRFVQRVEQAFQDVNSQGGSVRLRLSPPDLGSLRIEIKVNKGEMTARVEADSPSARNLILDNLPALRDRLAQHDIKVQRFDVDLMDRSGGGPANQSSQQQNPSWQDADPAAARAPERTASAAPLVVEAAPAPSVSGDGRLNVVV